MKIQNYFPLLRRKFSYSNCFLNDLNTTLNFFVYSLQKCKSFNPILVKKYLIILLLKSKLHRKEVRRWKLSQ